ncbi:MAG TPA: TrbG/VirB9 family P-type conjugative transfer protein [Burkholderiaceae bacterium]|nr:TrbG/VirB9 family P-type conjugative transfer protein [Burkholderiaceae bacterium]
MRKRWAMLSFICALVAPVERALADPRIREVAFDAKSVVAVNAKTGVTTMVEFGQGEHVLSVGAGQGADCAQASDPWCVAWPANAGFVFVRPKTRASTPLTLAVVTDRHSYSLQFDLIAPSDAKTAVFRLTFSYPEAKSLGTAAKAPLESGAAPAAVAIPVISEAQLIEERLQTAPVPVNSLYTIAFGKNSEELQPAMVFDDGRFTYIRWSGNREIPAVFEIRLDGSEMVANTRMEGDLIVVDRVARAFMLRSGAAVASLKNENFDPEGLAPSAGTTLPGVERALTAHEGRVR